MLWPLIKLVFTLAAVAILVIVARAVVQGINEAVASTKNSLAQKGVNVSSTGIAVKTDRREVTAEQSADAARSGIMKAWKASTFNVPWVLGKASNLSGSRHDKNKAEYEAKYGPKQHKHHHTE